LAELSQLLLTVDYREVKWEKINLVKIKKKFNFLFIHIMNSTKHLDFL
jgi:hypothetical protein